MRRLLLLLVLLAWPAAANDWDALRQPGAVAIMRHALAPGTGDPAGFRLDDCSTQRNLDARGRAQARAIGEALRDRGIAFDRVLSSRWCRGLETARLLDLGPVEPTPPLDSFFGDRTTEPAQTEAVRALLSRAEGRLMLVTHQVNISALTGRPARSGEIVVIRLDGDRVEVLGEILIDA